MKKTKSRKMTPELILEIKILLNTKQYHQHQIASMVDVNQGRISEVKNGKYDYILNKTPK